MFQQIKHRIKYLKFQENLEKYNTSSESNRWTEFTRYHEECRKSYPGVLPVSGIEEQIQCYKKNGFFTYFDENTEHLCQSVYSKLKEQGYLDKPNPTAETKSFLTHPSRVALGYENDAYTTFPEIEEIFKGPIGDIIRGVFGCNFDIFYSRIFKTENLEGDERDGSQLWHSDGGPSNCMIMFFHFTDVGEFNGGTEILPWDISKKIYKDTYLECRKILAKKELNKLETRYVKNCIYDQEININYKNDVVTLTHHKPGLIAAMNNNNLHRGGFTRPGYHRIILMTHLYPTNSATPFEKYREEGCPKKSPIPDASTFYP